MIARLAGIAGALACALTFTSAQGAQGPKDQLPTHCRPHEFAVANARMGPVIREAGGNLRFSRNGKIASLCADRAEEPFGSFTYRYGKPGNVEFERTASTANKFLVYESQTGHTGSDIVFFSAGSVTYYVTIAIGQGHGVGVHVFDGSKRIAELFSGNEEGVDFGLGPASMSFDAAASPIFQRRKPKHPVD